MATSRPIPIRLDLEWVNRFTEAAAAAGLPLSTYLKRRLQTDAITLDALAGIRSGMDHLAAAQAELAGHGGIESEEEGRADSHALHLEMLLLLRLLAGQARLDTVHAELRRQGLSPVVL